MNHYNVLVLGKNQKNMERIKSFLPKQGATLCAVRTLAQISETENPLVIVPPNSATAEEIDRFFRTDAEHISQKTTFLVCVPAKIPETIRGNIKTFKSMEELLARLKFILLERHNKSKKKTASGNRLLNVIRVLSLIQKNPEITTQRLAHVISASPRTVQRCIKTLKELGEPIYYDSIHHGWKLPGNRSSLWDEVNRNKDKD